MSDLVLTAADLLEKLKAERAGLLRRYEAHNGPDAWQEFADGDEADRAQAAAAFDIRRIESANDRGRLELIGDAIARIETDPANFDACQNERCESGGKIEHERLAALAWAKLCCACAAARERGGGSR